MFTQQEKELLIKIISDIKIHPLATDAVPMISMIQTIAKKIVGQPHEESTEADTSERKRKPRKTDDEFTT